LAWTFASTLIASFTAGFPLGTCKPYYPGSTVATGRLAAGFGSLTLGEMRKQELVCFDHRRIVIMRMSDLAKLV
jgi:hypothetical protein